MKFKEKKTRLEELTHSFRIYSTMSIYLDMLFCTLSSCKLAAVVVVILLKTIPRNNANMCALSSIHTETEIYIWKKNETVSFFYVAVVKKDQSTCL